MSKRRSIAPVIALLTFGLLVLAPASASATATCILSATDVVFGAFSGSELTATGTITIHCTGAGTSNYQLTLSRGSGTYTSRQMTSGANTLSYNLYTTSNFIQVWGDGTGATGFKSGQIKLSPPPSVDIVVTVFGRVPAQAIPAAGSYMDTIIATLTCTSGGNCTTARSFSVTSVGQAACTLSAANLAFGSYSGVVLDGTTTLSATCTSGAAYNIGLDAGTSTGATVSARAMTGPASALLRYGLFRDSARSANWGNTVGTDTVASTGTGSAQSFTVFGRVPAGQLPGAGLYQDTITATLTF